MILSRSALDRLYLRRMALLNLPRLSLRRMAPLNLSTN
jgi:hypothetical protein